MRVRKKKNSRCRLASARARRRKRKIARLFNRCDVRLINGALAAKFLLANAILLLPKTFSKAAIYRAKFFDAFFMYKNDHLMCTTRQEKFKNVRQGEIWLYKLSDGRLRCTPIVGSCD